MHYEGHAFNELFEKGKASGRITLNREGFTFRNDQAEITLPLNGIKIEMGGQGKRLVFITHPNYENWKLYLTDRSILKDPVIASNIHLQEQIKGIKVKKSHGRVISLVVLAILILGGWGIWALKGVFVKEVTHQIPVEWETKLGDSAFDQMAGGRVIIKDEELNKDLNTLVAPLLEAADNGKYKFRFHIVEDSTLNAAAFPGGNVIIHTGLILTVEKPEDLLGVLAHEIAHVNRRHSMQRLVNMAGMYLVLSATVGDVGALSGVILNGGGKLLELENSRSHEKDADEIGWDYLIKANINPRGLIDCFKIMEENIPDIASDIPDFLSTHPALSNRIEYLEEKWQKLEKKDGFIKIDLDYENFQQKLKKYMSENSGKQDVKTTESETKKDEAPKEKK